MRSDIRGFAHCSLHRFGLPIACVIADNGGRAIRDEAAISDIERGRAMDKIIERYEGKTTSEGHKLEVTRHGDELTIAFKHVGEYGDDYDPTIRVASIEEIEGGGYALSLFYRDAEEPTDSRSFTSERDLFTAVDKAVEERSKEVGPI